jgi:hypothetical protein
MGIFERRDDPVVAAIRDALGAVAVAKPAAYWLFAEAEGDWCVRREGHGEVHRFASRERALTFIRLAVVRCSSYCLCLQDVDGRITRRMFLGGLAGPSLEIRSTPALPAHMSR